MNSQRRFSLLELHAAVLLFALAGLFGKWLAISPLLIVLGRTVFASLALLPVVAWHGRAIRPHLKPALAGMIATGAVLAFHWVTFFRGIQVSSVSVGLLAFSSFPLFVTLLEPVLFRERFRAIDLCTATLVLAGLACIVPRFELSNQVTRGVLWGVASGLSFAILALMNRSLVFRHPPLLIAAGQDLFAALFLSLFLPFYFHPVTARDVGLMALLGILCTAVAHFLFIKSLSHLRAQLASVISGLEALYGVTLACVFLHERPGIRTLIGGGLIVSAVLLGTLRKPPAHSSDNPLLFAP